VNPKIINQEYAEVALTALKPHPMNPRRGSVTEIAKSIAHNGFYGALVAQVGTGGTSSLAITATSPQRSRA
jgi:hypothetical protein